MKIGILGCSGRMGTALIETIVNDKKSELVAGVTKSDTPFVGMDLGKIAGLDNLGINASTNIENLVDLSDVVIDFSSPEISIECAKLIKKQNKSQIIGTTGFNVEQMNELENLAKSCKILWSSNMSIGVNLLFALTKQVSSILDESYDIDILEMHHCSKVDSPSGTALSLGNYAAEGRNVNLNDVACYERSGIIGKRPIGEIGFATLRGGDVVGDHTVIFAGDGERIELSHKASSRKIFAKGALRAAKWLNVQSNGFYSMQDVLASN